MGPMGWHRPILAPWTHFLQAPHYLSRQEPTPVCDCTAADVIPALSDYVQTVTQGGSAVVTQGAGLYLAKSKTLVDVVQAFCNISLADAAACVAGQPINLSAPAPCDPAFVFAVAGTGYYFNAQTGVSYTLLAFFADVNTIQLYMGPPTGNGASLGTTGSGFEGALGPGDAMGFSLYYPAG